MSAGQSCFRQDNAPFTCSNYGDNEKYITVINKCVYINKEKSENSDSHWWDSNSWPSVLLTVTVCVTLIMVSYMACHINYQNLLWSTMSE